MGCALANLANLASRTWKNLSRQHRGQNSIFWKSWVWVGPNSHPAWRFSLVDRSSPYIRQTGGIAVDRIVFRLSMYWSVPEIFAFEIAPNDGRFWPQLFWVEGPKFCDEIIQQNPRPTMRQSFTELTQCHGKKQDNYNSENFLVKNQRENPCIQNSNIACTRAALCASSSSANGNNTHTKWCKVSVKYGIILALCKPLTSKNRLAAPPSAAALPAVTWRQYSRPKIFYF